MIIEWTSFFIGLAVGIVLLNISNLISAYVKRNRARADLRVAKLNLKKLYDELETKKQGLMRKAEELKK